MESSSLSIPLTHTGAGTGTMMTSQSNLTRSGYPLWSVQVALSKRSRALRKIRMASYDWLMIALPQLLLAWCSLRKEQSRKAFAIVSSRLVMTNHLMLLCKYCSLVLLWCHGVPYSFHVSNSRDVSYGSCIGFQGWKDSSLCAGLHGFWSENHIYFEQLTIATQITNP